MSAAREEPRYERGQIVDAVDGARGDGRYWLVRALLALTGDGQEAALAQVLEKELRADERQMVLEKLVRLRPGTYLPQLIERSLRSRSIGVQQGAVALLADVVSDALSPELADQVEGWFRRRMANPRRVANWATWDIPGAALTLLPSYGRDRIVRLLMDVEPRMQLEEREMWQSLTSTLTDSRAFEEALREWSFQSRSATSRRDPRDPTTNVCVDRVMKRLGYRPANPDSKVYYALAGSAVREIVIDLGRDQRP